MIYQNKFHEFRLSNLSNAVHYPKNINGITIYIVPLI